MYDYLSNSHLNATMQRLIKDIYRSSKFQVERVDIILFFSDFV